MRSGASDLAVAIGLQKVRYGVLERHYASARIPTSHEQIAKCGIIEIHPTSVL